MTQLRNEDGSVLITAILLMAIILAVGVGTYALVDQETHASAVERTRDASFNLAEQLLDAQVYVLSRDWPGKGGVVAGTTAAYPVRCSQASPTDARNRCPDAGAMMARFGGADVTGGNVQWSTVVRDDTVPAANYYQDTTTLNASCGGPTGANPCSWDANDNGELWVRAQAIVRGKRRTLIGRVKVDKVTEDFPKSAILAGKFGTTNSGRKVIVDVGTSKVQVRCATPPQSACMDYPPGKDQVYPDNKEWGYTGGDAMTDEQISRLRDRAIAEGSYYASCPARPENLATRLVFVESGNCSYSNDVSPCCYADADPSLPPATRKPPGVYVTVSGTLSFSGNIVFNGLIYAPNRNTTGSCDNSAGWVVCDTGTARINGAVVVDGTGGMLIGSSGNPDNLHYDANVFNSLIGYANAGIVQNTWREIPAAAGS